MGEPRQDNNLVLDDGRTLAYVEHGNPRGKPVFLLHGSPGSKLVGSMLASLDIATDTRLISFDRPGIGGSTFNPRRQILDLPNDVNALANHLGVETYSVVGYSSGGAYALACAFKHPGRIHKCGLVGSVIPRDHPPSFVKRMGDWMTSTILFGILERKRDDVDKVERLLVDKLPLFFKSEVDRKVITDPETIAGERRTRFLARLVLEYGSQGRKGPMLDTYLFARPWGFNLGDISKDVPIFIWHGEADGNVDVSASKCIAARLQHCKAWYLPGEGHLSIWASCGKTILDTVTT